MSEPPGLQSPLAIEAVRWSPRSGGELVVRVAGRWRDQRPGGAVRPVLVVGTEHDRYRFPASSQAPGEAGAESGHLPICFTLPAWLAPYLGGRLTLLLGSVSMALPPAIADGGAAGGEGVNGGEVLRGGEFPVGEVRAGRVATLVDRLELELEQARREAERLRAELEDTERERCQAEQLAHSEAAIRVDHEARIEHHRANARAVLALHQAAQIHARRIRVEIEGMRRSVEEEARADPAGPRGGDVTDAIHGIARHLDEVRDAVALLPALREPERAVPEPDPRDDTVVPDRLTAALERLREESAPTGRAESVASSEPAAPGEPAAAARSSRWLLPALRRLLREDPALAGVVITRLLAAQSLVVADPIRYDVVLSDSGGCRSVTASADGVRLELFVSPRPLEAVAFRIEGDLAGFGRLLVYGRLRRRLSRRVARVRGDRHAFAALTRLIREPFALPALYAAGVRLDPELALRLVAGMIDPSWTAGERFTIGYESIHDEDRVYLHVRDGARARVTREPPLGPVGTTIRSPGDELFALLAGVDDAEIELRGASDPVARVREWIARAQRDS